jgi:hypothetical protein
MRRRTIILFSLALAMIVLTQPAAAQPYISIPFVTTDEFAYIQPFAYANVSIIEANTSSLAIGTTAAFACSFTSDDPTSSEGPVFDPYVAQTTGSSVVYDRTYYFQDFFAP